jgi:molybdenum cofactor biosynthesis enzyme MoaA
MHAYLIKHLTPSSLKGMDNDKMAAPDGISIEDRLKSLVERTADDIKMCSNVCDAYMKKTPLAKVLMSAVWDAKLLDFVKLFATRRQEFEFEMTMHTGQGVDKANAKLDAIGEATRALNQQFGSHTLAEAMH